MIFETFRQAIQNVWSNKLRTFLTMLGIIIGVMAVIVIVGLGNGMTKSMRDSFSALGTNTLSIQVWGYGSRTVPVEEMYDICQRHSNLIKAVSPQVNFGGNASGTLKIGTTSYRWSNISGVDENFTEMKNYQIVQGRGLQYMDMQDNKQVCVIGDYLNRVAFGGNGVGQTLKIGANKFRVVGVLSAKVSDPTMQQGSDDDCVYLPYTTVIRLSSQSMVDCYTAMMADESLANEAKTTMEEELMSAKDRAEESNRLKSAFLANMSHEIRTPLNAIIGFSNILASTEEEQEKQEYINIIESNNTLLLQLISDILDLSKIEAGTLEFSYSNIDLNDMIKEVENITKCRMEGSGVQLIAETPLSSCFIRTEKNRLMQVINNFLTNAIKFTQKGSITFGYEIRDKMLYFHVTDTGCGIPANKKDSIFGRFVKLNSFAQGTGLGLSICRTIIEHMNGTIGVESEEGKGSTFWFTIPYQPARLSEKKAEEFQPITVQKDKLTILIAEDNESNYRLFQSILRKEYSLIHAWDGQEAIEKFKEHRPQIILMDINMPRMDGYEATKEIRKLSADVPIIAITAFAYASDEQRVLENGFDGYMSKPINAPLLKQQIASILQKRIIFL